MIWLFLASLASGEEPTDGPAIDVAGGAGFFSPLNRPWQVNPTLDGQADITQVVPGVPGLGASAGAQLGAWFPWGCGSSCGTQGVWRLGAGPTYATPFVDVSLLLRLVGFGSSVDVKPALQGTAKVDIDGPLELRPYVAVEGVRYPDLNVGLRVATRVTDRTQTRARQCEDGDTRTLDQPVQQVSYRWISELTPESIAWDYGEAYAGELDNPMGKMKGLLSDVLAISGSAQSARALGKGEAGVSDYVGRMQDVGSSYDGLDWSLPATPADLPTALANNYMEIGKRAIDALLPKLEEHRNRHLFGVNLT